ncbi:acyl transferase/acyl hydrolase/lysophospholipase [Globomyces pollinis-pini]|nr:acyl transferase/acyl hydrolase/lysophospholipase [Globomyces pollinis-pini]
MDQDILLENRLQSAPNYESWLSIAKELDRVRELDQWRKQPVTSLFDHKLITSRIKSLRAARNANDLPTMKLLIRSGLLRNLGGIMDVRLFTVSYVGTKNLIEEYLAEVTTTIQYIADLDAEMESLQSRLELFTEVEQSFGHTALLLHGGTTFGLYHVGVVEALYRARLLPKVISGSSIGALIAALICIHDENELPGLFVTGGINLEAFATKKGGSIRRKITRLLTNGYLLDIQVLEECVKANLGDITFEEAYAKTGMILNITVSSSRKNEIPRVLNHLTSPNVLIRSAACASSSMKFLYNSVDLLAKNSSGQIFVWSPSSIKWGNSYSDNDSPEQRLAELFNVNHFILSQAQPYIAPFLSKSPKSNSAMTNIVHKALTFTSSEIRFRMTQLARLGLIPQSLGSLFDLKIHGHVTIAPPLDSMDFYTIFGNPTYESLDYWILKGQRSTWPFLAMIKNRTLIEMKLYEVKYAISCALERRRTTIADPRSILKKRTQSIG